MKAGILFDPDRYDTWSRIRRPLAVWVVVMTVFALISNASPAVAEESKRQTLVIREKVYEKLSRAQQAAEKEDWDEAFDKLEDVEKMKDLDAHERAQLYTAYGYTYFAQQRYQESINAYEQVLQQESLPEALQASTRLTLAQLCFHQEDYVRAVEHLERWLTSAENPGPDPFILLAQAYYQVGRIGDAIEPVQQAIAIAHQRDQAVKENWYALLRAFYHELEDYPRLLEVLELLVTQYSSKKYWVHLASTYGELDDMSRQLAVYDAAFALGYLTSGHEQLLLVQLLMQADSPYRAAVILARGLDDGLIEGTAQNWRLLSQAWTLAHEYQLAITALTRAAALSDDGELNARIAQSHANLNDWESTVTAAREALSKGVENPHELQILIGMSLFELGRLDEARSAFADAQQSPEGRRTAAQWIEYIEREITRLREMEISLE